MQCSYLYNIVCLELGQRVGSTKYSSDVRDDQRDGAAADIGMKDEALEAELFETSVQKRS